MQFLDKTVSIPPDQPKHVVLVGCGAVGSFLSLVLAKISNRLTIIDKDTVEPHNIPTHTLIKPFLSEQTSKVHAAKLMLDAMTFCHSSPVHADISDIDFRELDFTREIDFVIIATDTVQSRITTLQKLQQSFHSLPNLKRIIDTGIDANGYRIAVINPDEISKYIKVLEAMPEREPDRQRACERARNFPVILALAGAVVEVILSC